MPHESKTVPCKSCGGRFKPTGIGPHHKSCLKNIRRTGEDLAFVQILRNADGLSRSTDHSDTTGPSGPGNSNPSHDLDEFWVVQVADERPMSINNDAGPHDHASPRPTTDNIDNIQVEYHPNSGKPTEKYSFAEFTRVHAPKPYKPDASTDPWYPFRTRLDFEFADLALEAALSKEQTNRLLKLVQRIHSNKERFTLRDYRDVESSWKAASHCMPAVSQPEERL
ncbi:hypothetical protein SCLCIDRAFT_23133 [Scleroderma citrinum Foug A]|uniref:Uncharacterized protein n=1 Tax=Scleroderma citrinum Foug A TaxID=1036808 RepID=A0A0C2ZU63_9AGAM|nr:hypothetical protein SCLCIDRAFT_23133 [Scleroderma citrinum Foug A]